MSHPLSTKSFRDGNRRSKSPAAEEACGPVARALERAYQ